MEKNEEHGMLERCARALCDAQGVDPDGRTDGAEALWERYVPEARAVLTALREPSKEMVEAAHTRLADEGDVSDIFTAMIDSLLNPQTGA